MNTPKRKPPTIDEVCGNPPGTFKARLKAEKLKLKLELQKQRKRIAERVRERSAAEKQARLAAASSELLPLIEWFLEFCAQHPEWERENFEEDTPEGYWLEDVREAVSKVRQGMPV
ncbi:MAG TPA: hypothetical protein VD994_15010 [Prosthecobacter sp.]|nr:hypothetical protein [Prosthecobacter sp.]